MADIYDHGFEIEMERIRDSVHYQSTKLEIIALQLNNLTKLYYIVFTITIQMSFFQRINYTLSNYKFCFISIDISVENHIIRIIIIG